MAGCTRVHQQPLVGGRAQRAAHHGQAADKLRYRQLELADQHGPWLSDRKAETVHAGRQRESQIGHQQRLAHFRFAAHEQNTLRRQQTGFHQ